MTKRKTQDALAILGPEEAGFIAKYDELMLQISEVDNIPDAAGIADRAAALGVYAKRQRWLRGTRNNLCRSEIAAITRAGVLVTEAQAEGESLEKIADRIDRSSTEIRRWQNFGDCQEAASEYEESVVARVDGELTVGQTRKAIFAEMKRQAAEERASTVVEIDSAIEVGDFRVVGDEVEGASMDCVFTDPPYDKESIGLFGDLARFSARVLRPGGFLITYAGQHFLPDYLVEMIDVDGLRYMWTGGASHKHGALRFRKYHIHNRWKPILVFYVPQGVPGAHEYPTWFDWWDDVVGGGTDSKAFHEWGQPVGEARHFLERLVPRGGSVVDPMCGGGSTLVAAKLLGLNYLGIEIDEDVALKASAALAEVKQPELVMESNVRTKEEDE